MRVRAGPSRIAGGNPVRFRNTCMFGTAHTGRCLTEIYDDGTATTSKPSSQGLNPMRIAEILISTHACGTTMRRTNKARCESKADVAAVSCIRPSSGASFSCEFPPQTASLHAARGLRALPPAASWNMSLMLVFWLDMADIK